MRETSNNNIKVAEAFLPNCKDTVLRVRREYPVTDGYKSITVAVTTAPRTDCTLAYCTASIEACGWQPIIFAEPGATETGYQTFVNEKRLGIWHNWLTACRWAIANGGTEYIMTVQDDSLFHPGSKVLADRMKWPIDAGFVSLYTPKHYSVLNKNPNTLRHSGINKIGTKCLWGACAMIFKTEVLERVLESPRVPAWFGYHTRSRDPAIMERRRADTSLVANSDTVIGKILNDMQLGMYFVEPSAVQHIAKHSTISHGGNEGNRNCFPCADFDKPLLKQVWG